MENEHILYTSPSIRVKKRTSSPHYVVVKLGEFLKKGKGSDGFSGTQVNGARGKGHVWVTATSLSTYDELGVPPHGNHGPVDGPEQLLHDYLHVPLRRPLEDDRQ